MTTTRKCNKCGIVKPISEFYTHKQCVGGIRPYCKACCGISSALRRIKNLDKLRAYRKIFYANTREKSIMATKIWQKENKDMANANKKRYEVQHPDRVLVSKKKWVNNNPEKVLAIKSRRRSRQLNAYPEWITAEHRKEIQSIYKKARHMTIETGIKHVVDHIWPLQGRVASGLHVPWNLQVLTAHDNSIKYNKIPNGVVCK